MDLMGSLPIVSERDVRILGVKHTDDRVHSSIQGEAEQSDGVGVVYHEWPESSHDLLDFLPWLLVKSPASIIPATLSAIISVVKMRRGVSVDSSGTAYIKSECKVATERLRDEYDADLVNVGMNRIDLLKRRSWFSALLSWGIVLLAIWIIIQTIEMGNPALLRWLIVPLILSVTYRVRTLDSVRDSRDEHMATAILQDYNERQPTTAFVIVGQKHVEGIASRVGRRFSPVCRWLSNEADLKDGD